MYPRDAREPEKPKLRLMYEANPMSLLLSRPVVCLLMVISALWIFSRPLCMSVAVFLGSKEEVERITAITSRKITVITLGLQNQVCCGSVSLLARIDLRQCLLFFGNCYSFYIVR